VQKRLHCGPRNPRGAGAAGVAVEQAAAGALGGTFEIASGYKGREWWRATEAPFCRRAPRVFEGERRLPAADALSEVGIGFAVACRLSGMCLSVMLLLRSRCLCRELPFSMGDTPAVSRPLPGL
jgi:hypothetical protein